MGLWSSTQNTVKFYNFKETSVRISVSGSQKLGLQNRTNLKFTVFNGNATLFVRVLFY